MKQFIHTFFFILMIAASFKKSLAADVINTQIIDPPIDVKKACDVLYTNLNRPSLRGVTNKITSYIDPFTLPQTKTECTHTYVITSAVKGCTKWGGFSWKYPLGKCQKTGVIVPETKGCDTWATYKKNMRCDLNFKLKLPNFVEQPISSFIDSSYKIASNAQTIAKSSLPLECANPNLQQAAKTNNPGKAIADAIAKELEKQLKASIEKQAKDWLETTGIKTIISAIPSGGLGGVAALATSIADFVIKVKQAIQPLMDIADNIKTVGQDMGFSTACGWGKWEKI